MAIWGCDKNIQLGPRCCDVVNEVNTLKLVLFELVKEMWTAVVKYRYLLYLVIYCEEWNFRIVENTIFPKIFLKGLVMVRWEDFQKCDGNGTRYKIMTKN